MHLACSYSAASQCSNCDETTTTHRLRAELPVSERGHGRARGMAGPGAAGARAAGRQCPVVTGRQSTIVLLTILGGWLLTPLRLVVVVY